MANCSNCGFKLEKRGNFCPSCGTSVVLSNNNDAKIKKALIVVVFLLFGLMTYFIGLSALQNNRMNKMNIVSINNTKIRDEYSNRITELENALDNSETQLEYLRSGEELYKPKSDYLDENVAFVVENDFATENSKLYHTYDCLLFRESSSYWLYSIDSAKDMGYTPCDICHQ